MVQIAFVTLFLGLTVGSQPIELTVSRPVAAVELLLLVLAGGPDGSRTDPALVRHYLEQIRVPLYVWSAAGSSPAAWSSVEDVSTLPKLTKAFQKIEEDLKSQTLIWVDGRHLPQSITLSPAAAEAVELLGY